MWIDFKPIKIPAFFLLLLALTSQNVDACTSAIITGRLTPDGRPLLWKHRDTPIANNRVEHFKGEKYTFIALVNSEDEGGMAWAGTNNTGFSIMITPQWIFNNLSRSFYHSLLDIDLQKDLSRVSKNGWFIDLDFIPRRTSSAAIVFQGVKPGEKPELTTMWTILGYPPLGIAIPLFEKNGKDRLPAFITKSKKSNNSELCDWVLQKKEMVFPIKRGSGPQYFNAAMLFNEKETGYTQKMIKMEDVFFRTLNSKINEWRKGEIDFEELERLYEEIYKTLSIQIKHNPFPNY